MKTEITRKRQTFEKENKFVHFLSAFIHVLRQPYQNNPGWFIFHLSIYPSKAGFTIRDIWVFTHKTRNGKRSFTLNVSKHSINSQTKLISNGFVSERNVKRKLNRRRNLKINDFLGIRWNDLMQIAVTIWVLIISMKDDDK